MSKLSDLQSKTPTHVLTTRVDGRHLATLASFWHERGEPVRTFSELIRLSIEEFTELLVTNDMVDFISSHSDAIDVLQRLGLTSGKLNKRNVMNVLTKESLDLSHLDKTQDPLMAPKLRKASEPKGTIDQDSPAFKDVLANLESEMLNPSNTIERQKEVTKEFKDHMGIAPPTNNPEEESTDDNGGTPKGG